MAMAVSFTEPCSTLLLFALLVGNESELNLPLICDVRVCAMGGHPFARAPGVFPSVVVAARSGLVVIQYYVQFRVVENAGARLSARLL